MNFDDIDSILSLYNSISIEDMNSVSLMNRIDTKYIISMDELNKIFNLIKRDYLVQDVNGLRNRLYTTIYFDTDDLTMFFAHHNNIPVRQKIRLRTYASTGNSFLEVKNRNIEGRTDKKRMQIKDNIIINEHKCNKFLHKHAKYDLSEISEKLQTNFNRTTLVNNQMTERITIDTNISFKCLQLDKEVSMNNLCIIEIKQNDAATSIIKNILHDMQIHHSSISKYYVGSILTNPSLKL
jgi:hypothetical protein